LSPLWRTLKKIFSDDSMSIALFSLFLVCAAGQGVMGWFAYNSSQEAAHLRKVALGQGHSVLPMWLDLSTPAWTGQKQVTAV